ncbi:MAG: PilZ domain-containing protein [Pseudomonadota bacterium]
MSGRERRQSIRAKARLDISYGTSELEHKGFTRDVSIGGVFLVARQLLAVDTRIHMELVSPEDRFYAEGKVMRVKQVPTNLRRVEAQGMGIRFMAPFEVVPLLVPRALRKFETLGIDCAGEFEARSIMHDQLSSGILVVPVPEGPPVVNTMVEFEMRLNFFDEPRIVQGTGRVLQLLEATQVDGKRTTAVLEVKDAQQLCAAIESNLRK